MESGKKNHNGEFSIKQEALIMQQVQDFAIPRGRDKTEIWAAIEAKIRQAQTSKVRKLDSTSWIKYGLAASVILAVGFFYLFNQFSNTSIQTATGEHLSFYLPDSSKVFLNESSKISYNISEWESERLVKLNGEAFFEVKKGKAFRVISDKGVVEVLGTSFNVFARDSKYIVDCMTGSVKVSNLKYDDYRILTPGLSSTIKNNQVLFMTRNKNEAVGKWRYDEFVYEESSLRDVIKEMEVQFKIKIQYNFPLDQRRYTGFFSTNSLDESLERVFPPMGLSYELIGDKEILISENNKDIKQE